MRVLTPWYSDDDRNEMLVALDYPASWSDAAGQLDAQIGADKLDRLVAYGENLSVAQIAALQTDARFVVLPDSGDLAPEQIDTLRVGVASVLSSDVAVMVTADTTNADTIANAVTAAVLQPPWQADIDTVAGEVYYYAGNLYEVIQAHHTQSDWTPDIVPALFKRYYEPSDDPWPWVQPTGAHDAYPAGARVLHNGNTWVSEIADNVWEPGSVGAEALWTCEDCEPQTAEWASGVAYVGDNTAGAGNGDVVTYNGRSYRCLQSHTSISTWTPPVVPALWLDLGPV